MMTMEHGVSLKCGFIKILLEPNIPLQWVTPVQAASLAQ